MPLYSYQCLEHGYFDEFGKVETSSEPTPCPTCKVLSKRVIVPAETRKPYSEKFEGRHYYPNVGKHFNSHSEYEGFLKATGREIVDDGKDSWDKKDEEYIGHNLRSGERRRSKTMYFT